MKAKLNSQNKLTAIKGHNKNKTHTHTRTHSNKETNRKIQFLITNKQRHIQSQIKKKALQHTIT